MGDGRDGEVDGTGEKDKTQDSGRGKKKTGWVNRIGKEDRMGGEEEEKRKRE